MSRELSIPFPDEQNSSSFLPRHRPATIPLADDLEGHLSAGPGICELCGSVATELFPIEMYKITDSTRILNTADIRYQTKTVMVPVCKHCHDKGSWIAQVYAIVFALLFIAGLAASIFVLGLRGFFGVGFGGFLAFLVAWILSFPLSLLTADNRVASKSKTIKELIDEGWNIGKGPTKADM